MVAQFYFLCRCHKFIKNLIIKVLIDCLCHKMSAELYLTNINHMRNPRKMGSLLCQHLNRDKVTYSLNCGDVIISLAKFSP